MDIHIICNPVSGGSRGLKALDRVKTVLRGKGIPFAVSLTEGPRHAETLALAAGETKADRLLVIGGDGTLSEAAAGAVGAGLPMGIIPAGTGNDFVKTVDIPMDPDGALGCFLAGSPKDTDALRLNDRLVLNEAGTGFDVMVLEYARHAKRFVKGLLPYLYGVIQTIFRFRSVHLTYQADDSAPVTRDVLVIGAGNGRFIGGGIPIAPEADPADGLMDFVLVEKMKKGRMLSVLPGLLQGKILTFPETEFTRVKKLILEGAGLVMNIDGEIVPMERVSLEVLPGALKLFRP